MSSFDSPIDKINDLAKYIDDKNDSPPRSPKVKPSRETTESFVKNTKSNIHGWSPTRNKDSGKNRRPSGNQIIDNFTLTPIASDDTPSVGDNNNNNKNQIRTMSANVDADKKKNKGKKGGDPAKQYPKKPKLSKKERRALQEAQRARKAALKEGSGGNSKKGSVKNSNSNTTKNSTNSNNNNNNNNTSSKRKKKKNHGGHAIFSHLTQYQATSTKSEKLLFSKNETVHPAIIRVGLKYARWKISGSNARCVAMLHAIKEVIMDYTTPPNQVLQRHLDKHLKPMINFIVRCRPLSSNMGNAINFVKASIAKIGTNINDEEAKETLCERIDRFILTRITSASDAIVKFAIEKVLDGDVILTYGRSYVVEKLLIRAFKSGINFQVVVVDSRPRMEGRGLLSRLAKVGIKCTYVLLSGVSYVMKEVTKIILGASSMMANGAAASRVGTACVAMMANNYHKPVIFCCETYKFTPRVQLDSIVDNEMLDPDELSKNLYMEQVSMNSSNTNAYNSLKNWKENNYLNLLNIAYDFTPCKFIDMIITEVGMMPASSVPVIIREYEAAIND